MPTSYFPLRWESTGDQWWYASPIDWAAANGYYDVVLELLYLDTNLLIKLTSLRRIRRLETVWDDEAQFDDIAQCRSQVARKLFLECETKSGTNSLIRARYGGWLLYTAASAGDMGFVQELLERDPFLVFGEGEYGVSDIFYAAARGKNYEVFMLLFDLSLSPKCLMNSDCGELEEKSGEIPLVFRWEMMNRAVHAVARGGNLEILKELIGDCPDVLVYRDVQGSTILHAASSRGKVEVVEYLMSSFDIITSTDNQGNTALHVAAYQGHLAVVEALILSSPGSTSLTNNSGDTFLHMVVTSFCTPGFRRLDRQIELMKQLVYGKIVNMQDVINMRNNHGRTALHMAVVGNIHSDLVELLMTMPSIDLNIPDVDGMTPLDLLKQRRHSASSEILIKHLISAGGISNCQDHMARSAIVSHLKMQGVGSSPGTTFRIPDAEIFLYSGIETTDGNDDQVNVRLSSCSSEQRHFSENKKLGSARRLKILLWWPKQKGKKSESVEKLGDEDSLRSYNKWGDFEDTPTPLRQRFSKQSSLTNNKRVFSVGNNYPSPSTKKKFALGLMHGVIQPTPHLTASLQSPCSYFSRSSMSSPTSLDKLKGVYNGSKSAADKSTLVNKRLMNQYFCFGAQGLTVDDQVNRPQPHHDYEQSVLTMAQ